MSSHRASRNSVHKRHRIWPWAVSVVVLLVAIIAFLGIVGFNVYRQAKEVQEHESKALSMLSDFSTNVDDTKVQQIKNELPQIQQETRQASTIAHGTWWNIAQKMPYIGDDVTAVQGMTLSLIHI